VLQRMIKQDQGIQHPAVDSNCPVLQYADDTLLLVRAEITDVRRLRKILNDFASASGLKINFSKSTLVPMHVPAERLQRIVRLLQCQLGAFPQTYLGLPLSNVKPNLSAFAPLTHIQGGSASCRLASRPVEPSRPPCVDQLSPGRAHYLPHAGTCSPA